MPYGLWFMTHDAELVIHDVMMYDMWFLRYDAR